MKSKIKTARVVGVLMLGILSISSIGIANIITPKEEVAYAWSGAQTPNYNDSYYSRCEGLTGTALLNELQSFNRPQKPSYDWSRYEAADEMEGDPSSIFCIYTRTPKKKSAHCGNYAWDKWNREHICPQGRYPRSDTDNHNIYACEGQINNYRGNLNFNDVKNSGGKRLSVFGHQLDCYKTSLYFEPPEESKGEVARAVMYCSVYYGYKLTELFPSNEKCLEWHYNDPVDNRDIFRNNTVDRLQGNRNPFVDHPEYANAIWGDGTLVPSKPTISFTNDAVTLEEGETIHNRANIKNGNGTITYTTKDSNIATVDNVGNIKGIKEGNTVIYAKANIEGEEISASCNVKVIKPVGLQALTMNKSSVSIEKGAKVQLNVTPTPSNASNNVTWSTANADIASVTNGYVKGLKEGKTTITATSIKNPEIFATCEVTVTKATQAAGFKKVTEEKPDYTGEYVIAYTQGTTAKVLSPASKGVAPNCKDYKINNDLIEPSAGEDKIVIEKASNGYYLSIGENEVFSTIKEKGLDVLPKTSENAVSIELDSSNNIIIKASNGSSLKYNTGWGNFRFYKSGQESISLFEKVGSSEEPDVPPVDPDTSEPDVPPVVPSEPITLKEFNDTFLTIVTCDGKGAMTGEENAWSIMEEQYNRLSDDDKVFLKTASSKDETVGKALERYDYILAKYGVEKFNNYIGREIVQEAHILDATNSLGVGEITIIAILSIAIVATSIIGVVYLAKRKKN